MGRVQGYLRGDGGFVGASAPDLWSSLDTEGLLAGAGNLVDLLGLNAPVSRFVDTTERDWGLSPLHTASNTADSAINAALASPLVAETGPAGERWAFLLDTAEEEFLFQPRGLAARDPMDDFGYGITVAGRAASAPELITLRTDPLPDLNPISLFVDPLPDRNLVDLPTDPLPDLNPIRLVSDPLPSQDLEGVVRSLDEVDPPFLIPMEEFGYSSLGGMAQPMVKVAITDIDWL